MELTGTILKINEPARGTSSKGDWVKQEFIIETQDEYPKKVCMSIFNNPELALKLNIGSKITASVNIESKEYNDRWYTEVKAWKISAA